MSLGNFEAIGCVEVDWFHHDDVRGSILKIRTQASYLEGKLLPFSIEN